MKGAPLRIERHENQIHLGAGGDGGGAGKYAAAVTKLIPAEVVAAYLTGKAMLQTSTPPLGIGWWLGWTGFCLVVVVGLRKWMTSDTTNDVPVEWSAVIISALSFIVWVYSFGDVFQMLDLWNKVGSALVLIGWSLASPFLFFVFQKLFRE